MAEMKIGEVGEDYSSASFTFPDNPETVDIPANPNKKFNPLPMGKRHVASDYGGTEPKSIVLTGQFRGNNRRDQYNNLAEHLNEAQLKKYFVSDTKFYYVLGQRIKETLEGKRTTFVPYVAALWTPIPYAFSDTLQTFTQSLSTTSATTLNSSTGTGSFDNNGNAPTWVTLKVENTGSSDITQVEFGDNSVDGSSVDGSHTMTWQGTLAPGDELVIHVLKYAAIGDDTKDATGKFTKYAYPEVNGSNSGNVTVENSFDGLVTVEPGATDQDMSIQLSGEGNADITAEWRDAYRA